MTRRIACLLSFSSLVNSAAQLQPSPVVTGGMLNGRFWLKLDKSGKMAFVVGCQDAFFFGSMYFRDFSKIPDMMKMPELQTAETVKELDLFYSEGANGPVEILFAIHYVRRKGLGDTNEQLQDLLSKLRKSVQPAPAK